MTAHRRVVQRLATAVVGVPDPVATAGFLVEGLRFATAERGDAIDVLCAGDFGQAAPQTALQLVERATPGLVELRFELAAGVAAEDVVAAVTAAGADDVTPGDGEAAFTDPNGIRVSCGPAATPALTELPADGLRPRRLGHANVKAVDLRAGVRFWTRALGFWLSEEIGDDLAFLRYGSEHHNLGLRVADTTALHHLGFEIPGWEAYRPILDHLADAGHQVEFGPGRHGVGRNMFTYLRDPHSGLRLELFCDMAHVEHQVDPEEPLIRWRAEDRMSRTLNRWGSGPPPASFIE